ncbi:SCP2 sterol-binding domain-containing protein [Neobacillus niacini]|uniref:SCP2 sterol-binding domain-containing protein n=1 Tax=Neobacillus niacini TaxID=86668 RepID=UPI0021CB7248|nr:SCP2 sterol-binding domain-containing protein [Neobacillus niacini]MCM3765858.1 SCP2 sterol-binding domain-containing protein [Neobacillus niacini]
MMNKAVNSFLMAVKEQGQLQPLLESADLRLSLITEEQTIQLVFKNGVASVTYGTEIEPTMYSICGDADDITRLLRGSERLRTLQKGGFLKVSAPLRMALLLESIFYLAKPDRALVS